MEIQSRTASYAKLALLVLVSFYSLHVGAVSAPVVSGNQASGNYTVTYNYTPTYPAIHAWLEEKVNDGAWTPVTDSEPFGTINFAGKANATYQYRVGQLENSYTYPITFHASWSSAVSVVVTGGAPSSMLYSNQLSYTFQARKGDINSDGLQDLYIKRTSGGTSNNGVLYETILKQQADHTFAVLSASTSQKLTAASWPTINVGIIPADFNIDGYIDLLIKNIDLHIPNAANQLVFSSGSSSNGQPSVVTSLGSQMTKTMANILGSFSVPNYFDQFMIQVPVFVPVLVCGFYYDYSYEAWLYGCWVDYVTATTTAYDGDFVTQEGLNFGFAWAGLEQAGTDADFRTSAEFLYDVMKSILGIDVGKFLPNFDNKDDVEEVLAKIWVILSGFCEGANDVSECVPISRGPIKQSALNAMMSFMICLDQFVKGQAPWPSTGSPYRTSKVPHSSTQNFSITSSQLSYSNGSTDATRRNFWLSRLNTSKDPMGSMGVNIVDNAYLLGCMANQRLLLYADQLGKTVSFTTIGFEIIDGHIEMVGSDSRGLSGKLSAGQIRNYHVEVFDRYKLPARTFGGAPVTGSAFEAEETKFLWCPSCE